MAAPLNNPTPKLCECGCGEAAPIAKSTAAKYGWIKGRPMRFIRGHYGRRLIPDDLPRLCACGCGSLTNVADGRAKRFVHGHNVSVRVLTESDYTPRDHGYKTLCWDWNHCKGNRSGHGRVTIRKKKMWAHRAMWEQTFGSLPPKNLVLDHLCLNPTCIRPSHLEPVTQGENVRRWREARQH